jgi:sugar diacid utilization regulator
MVAIPLLVGDDLQGMLLFDNGTDFYPCLPEQVRLAQIIGRTASHALAQAEQSAAGVGQLRAAVARTRTLGRVTLAEQRFLEIAAGGGGIGDLLGAAASILRRPVAFHDKSLRRLAVAEAPEQGSGPLQQFEHGAMTVEDLVAQFRDTPPGGHATVGPVLDLGVHHRHLVAPVDHGGIRAGWVLTVEHPSRLSSFDELILTRLAAHLALVLATQQRMREANSDARSQLALQLLLGADDVAAVRRNAECLGVPVDAPRVVAHVRAADGPLAVDVDRFVHNAGRNLAGDVLASLGRDGLALLVEVSGEVPAVTAVRSVKGALAAACAAQRDEAHLMAGVSTVCAGHEDLPRGYREAQEVQRCVVGLRRPSVQVLTADDLGPIRLFLGNSNPEAVERFVNDILGRVVADGRSSRTLLTTLQEFFDADCSVRLTAARLGVHENTVRKRLGKISTLTGLDVASRATDQMTVHSALTVLRLRGDLPGGPAPDV